MSEICSLFPLTLFSEVDAQMSFSSPRTSGHPVKEGYSYESPPSSPKPYKIDKSIHLSPTTGIAQMS